MDLSTAENSSSFSSEDLNSSDCTATSLLDLSSSSSSSNNELDFDENKSSDDEPPHTASHNSSRSKDPLSQPLCEGADVTIHDC